jgi:hypothetical protein
MVKIPNTNYALCIWLKLNLLTFLIDENDKLFYETE